MKSWVEISDKNGTRTVDTTQIDAIMEFVNDHVMQDKPLELGKSSFEAVEMLRNADLSNEQLRWLADQLIGKVFHFGRMWKSSLTRKHYEFLKKLLDVKDMAQKADPPVDLWPELDE